MHIYIDESGTFQVPSEREYLLSVVAALVIPTTKEAGLFYEFMRLRNYWGITPVEVKGRELDEKRIAEVIEVLVSYDVLVEFLAIDMAWHSDAGLTLFKESQARAMLDSLTPKHQPTLVDEMIELSKTVEGMSNQLFVQAYLTMRLVENVVQTATLYYCQRIPKELGSFNWVIDRKDREITTMERIWTTLIIPVGQSRALTAPFITLKGGNYEYFARFRLLAGDVTRQRDVVWLEENVTFPAPPGDTGRIIDMKKILQECFTFADSTDQLGLQLADIVATTCRRAFNGHLDQSGWEGLGRLLIKKRNKPPIVGLATPDQAIGRDRKLHEAPSRVWRVLDARARSMWP